MLEKFLSIQNEISKLLQNRFPPPLKLAIQEEKLFSLCQRCINLNILHMK